MDYFSGGETGDVVRKELLPALENVARAEFGSLTLHSNMQDGYQKELGKQEKILEEILCWYLRELLKMHIRYGEKLEKQEKKLDAEFEAEIQEARAAREALQQAQSQSEQKQA